MAVEAELWSLEATPTWAVATVCFVLISVSLLIEHGLHLLAQYFSKRKKKSLLQSLNKVKAELMLLGFVSLFLTVLEQPIANICIPKSVGESFLPCQSITTEEEEESKCEEQGKLSLVSRAGVQQLQLLIFALAFYHVFSCFLTFSLGIVKVNGWRPWEEETRTLKYQFSNDPRRFKLIHQTPIWRRHLKFWSEYRYLRLPACFLRHFYQSVSKFEYFILRHGFISAHVAEGSNYNFQKYLRRNLERDFGVVVGISFRNWIFSVIYLFLNAYVFHNHFWLPFTPIVLLLIVGIKLQGIITRMCLDTYDTSLVVKGTLLVKPSDHYFWFGRPKLLLHLVHFILFQNSFQLAFFTWSWLKFGLRSCFHHETADIVITLATGLVVHILCGYVTLPLYALVTQMGTSMKKDVFSEGVVEGLKKWRSRAEKNVAMRNYTSPARTSLDASITSLENSAPSFSTLGVSYSLELDSPEFVSVHFADDDDENAEITEHRQKTGSFEGFHLS